MGSAENPSPNFEEEKEQESFFDRQQRRHAVEGYLIHELLMSPERGEPTLGVRLLCSILEEDTFEKHPNRMYREEQFLTLLADRRHAILYVYPLRPYQTMSYFDTEQKKFVSVQIPRPGYIEDKEQRENIAEELGRVREELQARMALLRKFYEQETFGGDLDQYAQLFVKVGKEFLASRNYSIILNLGPTVEGLAPFGEKIEEAFRAWKDIGDGKAEVTIDGVTKKFPNLFGMPANRGLLEIAMREYVIKRIADKAEGRSHDQLTDSLLRLEEMDNRSAAILGLQLFRHWDYDANSAIASKREGMAVLFEGVFDMSDLNLEAGALSKDSVKLKYFEVRRQLDATSDGKNPREHMRAGWGNPITRGCFPVLTAPALDIISCDMVLSQEQRSTIENEISGRLDPGEKADIPYKTKMTIHDRVFGNEGKRDEDRYRTDVEVTVRCPNGETRKEVVNIAYQPTRLGDSQLWDSAQIIIHPEFVNNKDNKVWQFAFGAQTEAFEVPYKLQIFCVWRSIYQMVMSEKYKEQFKASIDVGGDNLLLKANRPWDVGLTILLESKGIRGELARKLNNYTRAVWLGGLAAAQVKGKDGAGPEEEGTLVQDSGETYLNQVLQELSNAAARTKFLPTETKGADRGKVKGGWWGLVEEVARKRKAPRPSECFVGQARNRRKLFSEEEIDRLRILYPLGV